MRRQLPAEQRAVTSIVDQLGSGDLVSLVTFDDRLRVWANQASPSPQLRQAITTIDAARFSRTAMWDALTATMSLVVDAPGRPVVFVLGDQADSGSWLTRSPKTDVPSVMQDALFKRLRRTGVAVDVVWYRYFELDPDLMMRSGIDIAYGRIPRYQLPGATGGEVFELTRKDLPARLARRIEELRASYILTYVPKGVGTADGWHKLSVRLKNRKGDIKVRSGYDTGPIR